MKRMTAARQKTSTDVPRCAHCGGEPGAHMWKADGKLYCCPGCAAAAAGVVLATGDCELCGAERVQLLPYVGGDYMEGECVACRTCVDSLVPNRRNPSKREPYAARFMPGQEDTDEDAEEYQRRISGLVRDAADGDPEETDEPPRARKNPNVDQFSGPPKCHTCGATMQLVEDDDDWRYYDCAQHSNAPYFTQRAKAPGVDAHSRRLARR